MFLILGAAFLSIGVLYVLHVLLFTRMPKIVSFSILFLVSIGMIATLTVHGFWLGLTLLVIGVLWLRFIHRQKEATKL